MNQKAKPYFELIRNFLWNAFCVHTNCKRFLPLITNFYLTKRCNLRCRFCYPPGDEKDLDVDTVLILLDKIRPHSPTINFTGGEPLLYKGIHSCLKRARELSFYPVILSTNGLLIHRYMDDLKYVDNLIFSLDSLDEKTNDTICGKQGITKQIIHHIINCASLSDKLGFRLSIHTAICPENINELSRIVEFCQLYNISWSASPEHGRYYPNSELVNNIEYSRCIDNLIKLKKEGKPITCSYQYLNKIRDFSKHSCYPYISPRVEPDGRVYFPCQRMKKRYVYLQDYQNLYQLMRKETSWFNHSGCSDRCFLACYLEVEQYLKHPFSLLKEIPFKNLLLGKNGYFE